MKISVLVPYSPAGAERERSWSWIRQRWEQALPQAEIILGSPDDVPGPGLFSRANAINRAAAQASGEVFVIADADTAFVSECVYEAAFLACLAPRRWVLPDRYVRLSEAASDAWLASAPSSPPPDDWEDGIEEEWPANVSGIVVVPRNAFLTVRGFDERFTGWGCEDEAFACALSVLWTPPLRLVGHAAWHLWHPRPPEHSVEQPAYQANRALANRYRLAMGRPSSMKRLLAER